MLQSGFYSLVSSITYTTPTKRKVKHLFTLLHQGVLAFSVCQSPQMLYLLLPLFELEETHHLIFSSEDTQYYLHISTIPSITFQH